MPLYTNVLSSAVETVEKLLRSRASVGRVYVDAQGGETASMEQGPHGMTLHMPSLTPDAMLTRGEADRMVGYLVHETAHQLHTDWTAWVACCSAGDKFVQHLTNVFEDLRIEHLEITQGPWAGFGTAVETVLNYHATKNDERARAARVVLGTRASDIPWLLALIGRKDIMGLNVPAAEPTRARIDPRLRPIFDYALAEAAQTRSTRDCWHLALETAKRLALARQEEEKKQQEEQAQSAGEDKGQGQGQGQGRPDQDQDQDQDQGQGAGEDQGQGQGAGEDQGQGAGEDQGQGQGQGAGEDPGAGEDQGQGQGAGLGTFDTAAPGAPDGNLAPNLHPHPEANRSVQRLTGTTLSLIPRWSMPRNTWRRASFGDIQTLRAAIPRSASLTDQIAQLIEARETREREHHLTTGRIDRRALTRAALGDRDIYTRRHLTPGVNTAVTLLLDASSSMAGARLAAAQAMALHIGEAVDIAGGKLAVLAFVDASRGGNMEGCSLVLLKDWRQTMRQAAPAIAGMEATSGTPLSPAIIAASKWTLQTAEPADRYLLGVLTDGKCAYGGECTRTALRTADKLGLEPFGLGCEYDLTDTFRGYPFANVFNLADLSRKTMASLLTQLEAQRRAGGRA